MVLTRRFTEVVLLEETNQKYGVSFRRMMLEAAAIEVGTLIAKKSALKSWSFMLIR